MLVNHQHFRTIWPDFTGNQPRVKIIDQTKLPHAFLIEEITHLTQMIVAIKTMQVRGAPLIGASAAYGIALAMLENTSDSHLAESAKKLIASRPTAVNLNWAVQRMLQKLNALPALGRLNAAWDEAAAIADEDIQLNQAIGRHGLVLIDEIYRLKARPLHILTHCNAGWLATVDYGTALAPIYAAHDAGIEVHVWVDETRPRNQGASLTAWELAQHGVPHTVISDNAGGHLMQQGDVDMVIVGADRVTSNGDVCNKIGTYLKALAAHDSAAFGHHIPFYAAVPSPTIDWHLNDGVNQIEIEERHADELSWMSGRLANGDIASVNVLPKGTKVANPAFDVTPARLVTGIITEQGVYAPSGLINMKKSI
ncbi:MAG: S-methyl-5-thioribose-1-phosphate isomerase [Methylotenera sp. 24-45-7]|jgi:methylthioribose-1-phosphate isomerase|nr:MAG: S-methyl-5-thioribose-1-phosphate isomerase [Methylotenera sp. 24-45-7]OZA08891.1 MAG: S-methyl-5-thioribose-1-phosphate isomerase [Methylotenera sp. 17-45-7]OZA54029.1 MAG: S-methyl-5-thioribose-1-phosphate isomerase [Methylophilales bacterium 39-45-7]HQS37306.1 S-methyl-5-thioribose-1-phosphate isomerase [Methylotenera sp.]HQS42922.1 S-methyl-5-thioribose-1-phosphate isomerase [Methylotenera sp.]